jgi:hypothetical protein
VKPYLKKKTENKAEQKAIFILLKVLYLIPSQPLLFTPTPPQVTVAIVPWEK